MKTTIILIAILALSVAVHTLTVVIAILAWGLMAGALFTPPLTVLVGIVGGVPIGAYAMWGYLNMPETPCCVILCNLLDHFDIE